MREKHWISPYCYLYPNTSLAPSPSVRFKCSVTSESTECTLHSCKNHFCAHFTVMWQLLSWIVWLNYSSIVGCDESAGWILTGVLEEKTVKGIEIWLYKKTITIIMSNDIKSHTGQLRRSPVLFAACSNSPNMSDLSLSFFPNVRSTCWLCTNIDTIWMIGILFKTVRHITALSEYVPLLQPIYF